MPGRQSIIVGMGVNFALTGVKIEVDSDKSI